MGDKEEKQKKEDYTRGRVRHVREEVTERKKRKRERERERERERSRTHTPNKIDIS